MYSEENSKGAKHHDEQECEEKIDSTHSHRKGRDDEVAAHFDNAKTLLEITYDKTHK